MPGAIADLLSDFSSPMPAEGTGMGIFRRVRQPIVPETSPAENAVDEQAELIRSIEDRVRAEERERARQQLDQALYRKLPGSRYIHAAMLAAGVVQEAEPVHIIQKLPDAAHKIAHHFNHAQDIILLKKHTPPSLLGNLCRFYYTVD